MASISVMVTDNENGVINSSFNFSEQDIKRIQRALAAIYKPQLELPPLPNPNGELIPQNYNPAPRDIFYILAKSLISHVVNTCQEEELNQTIANFKESNRPIDMRDN